MKIGMTSLESNLVICIECVHKYAFKNYIECDSKTVFLRSFPPGNHWKVCKNVRHSVVYNIKILISEYESTGRAKVTYSLSTINLRYGSVRTDTERYSLRSVKYKIQMAKQDAHCDARFCVTHAFIQKVLPSIHLIFTGNYF